MEVIIEYPKALYPSPDQRPVPAVAQDEAEEQALRDAGHKTLAEWWADTGVPDAEPDEWLARLAAEAEAAAAAKNKAKK